jgi:anti-sigma factor RsiW
MKECLDERTLQGYFDSELSSGEAERAAAHLAACTNCAAAALELQSEMSLLAMALQPEFEVSVPTERLRGRLEGAIAELQASKTGRAYRGRSSPRAWFGWLDDLFAGSPQRAFSYAAVAAVVIAAVVLGVIYLKRQEPQRIDVVRNDGPTQTPDPRSSPKVPDSPVPGPAVVKSPDVAIAQAPRKSPSRRLVRETETTAKLLPGEQGYFKTIAALDATIKSNAQPMRAGLQVEFQHNLAVVDQAIAQTRAAVQKNPKDPDAAQFLSSAYQSKVDLMNQVAEARIFNTKRK